MNVAEILERLPQHEMQWLDSSEAIARLSASASSGIVREQWKYTPLKGFFESFDDSLGNAIPTIEGAKKPQIELVSFSNAQNEDLALLNNIFDSRILSERYPMCRNSV